MRGKESRLGGPVGTVEEGDVCETEASKEADVDVDVGGIDYVGGSGYESERFTLSEILRKKRLPKRGVSEGAVDTSRFPQCEVANCHCSPLTFLLQFLGWPVTKFFCASSAVLSET